MEREKRRRKMRPKFIPIFKVIFKKQDDGGRQHTSVSSKEGASVSCPWLSLTLKLCSPLEALSSLCSVRSLSPWTPVEGDEDKIGTGHPKDPPFLCSEWMLSLSENSQLYLRKGKGRLYFIRRREEGLGDCSFPKYSVRYWITGRKESEKGQKNKK